MTLFVIYRTLKRVVARFAEGTRIFKLCTPAKCERSCNIYMILIGDDSINLAKYPPPNQRHFLATK